MKALVGSYERKRCDEQAIRKSRGWSII